MRSGNQKLSALRYVDPTRWRAEIIAALQLEEGYVGAAVKRLRITRNTLQRWLREDSELRIAKRKIVKEVEEREEKEREAS